MSYPVISVENLSKSYRLGQIGTGTLTNDLKVWWAKKRGLPNPLLKIGQTDHGNRDGETLWALRDVSFTVQQGEVLGIIGRNGAGKSTLLKILSRVTAPTSGCVKVKGRIASLLEVGTGFHPELTGRENIYLNGAILGMSRQEITRKFDEIVAFAEVEKFIDTPVKRYSSGMYVRLAFAVAAHLESEILLVDEVLAVGDAEFQKKCLGKMGDVASQEGRTVLFVSHNMAAVQSLCEKSLLLEKGKFNALEETEKVIVRYLTQNAGSAQINNLISEYNGPSVAGISLSRNNSGHQSSFQTGDRLILNVVLNMNNPMRKLYFGVDLLDVWERLIFAFHSKEAGLIIEQDLLNEINIEVIIPQLLLLPGQYHFRILVANQDGKTILDCPRAVDFEILPKDFSSHGYTFNKNHGMVFMPFVMKYESGEYKGQSVVNIE